METLHPRAGHRADARRREHHEAAVIEMLGLADRPAADAVFDLFEAVMQGRIEAALHHRHRARARADLGEMLGDLLELIHTISPSNPSRSAHQLRTAGNSSACAARAGEKPPSPR